jgi:hypothetical protein
VPDQVGEDISPASADERPDEVAGARGEHGEPPGACAAQHTQKDSLGAVVGVVAGRDDLCADAGRLGSKRFRATLSSPRLEISPRRHIEVRTGHRDLKRSRHLLGQVELGRRLGAKSMVHAMGNDLVPQFLSKKG